MKELGADVVFNYKTTKVGDVLEKEGPIDIYWDNVGGEAFDAVLANPSRGCRIIECGMITTYNHGETYHMKNLNRISSFEIKIYGFVVTTLVPKYPEFYTDFTRRIANGEIKYTEDITQGLENGGFALEAVLKGKNTAKSVIAVA